MSRPVYQGLLTRRARNIGVATEVQVCSNERFALIVTTNFRIRLTESGPLRIDTAGIP
jgi:hypothetical protein